MRVGIHRPFAAAATVSLLLHGLLLGYTRLPQPAATPAAMAGKYLHVRLAALPSNGIDHAANNAASNYNHAEAPKSPAQAHTSSTSTSTSPIAPVFVPSSALDTPLLPMSAPDTDMLRGHRFTGMPIGITLYVNAQGTVVDVVLQPRLPEDGDSLQALRDMFFTTRYIPPLQRGEPVQAMLGLELSLDFL